MGTATSESLVKEFMVRNAAVAILRTILMAQHIFFFIFLNCDNCFSNRNKLR